MQKDLILKYKNFVDEIAIRYGYDNNIKHLLYLIIPAFVYKYNNKHKLIMETFMNTPIIISDKESKNVKAFYTSILKRNGSDIYTSKYIIIYNYNNISLITLLDSLIHEYNHAVNSYLNEITINDNYIYIRTGLTQIKYSKDTFKFIDKMASYILEEIINTKQTEEIIDIIKNYNNKDIEEISNVIYAINSETDINYQSEAYFLETNILKKLLSNNTFIYTLENLRIDGNINDIEKWFDNITGINNSYNNLINYLNNIVELEEKLIHVKYFKSITINKIRNKIDKINEIINRFNLNSNAK